jgi:hypothetical protein
LKHPFYEFTKNDLLILMKFRFGLTRDQFNKRSKFLWPDILALQFPRKEVVLWSLRLGTSSSGLQYWYFWVPHLHFFWNTSGHPVSSIWRKLEVEKTIIRSDKLYWLDVTDVLKKVFLCFHLKENVWMNLQYEFELL